MSELQRLRHDHGGAVLVFELENRAYFAQTISDRGDAYFDHFDERHAALLAEQEAGTCICYVLVDEDGSILGRFNLVDVGEGTAELGYRVAQRAAGCGVATSTVRELCRRAVTEHGLHILKARTTKQNIGSVRVLAKCGFRLGGPADVGGRPGVWYLLELGTAPTRDGGSRRKGDTRPVRYDPFVPASGVEEASGLTGGQLEAISDLARRVVEHDGGRLKLEWGVLRQRPPGEVNDLLAWRGETLAGFCGIYQFGSEPELAGAVDPAHRSCGIGSALLDRALAQVAQRGRSSVLLVTPRATRSGRQFAESKGAIFAHAEHHMELHGPPIGPPAPRPSTEGLVVRPATDADRTEVVAILEDAFGRGTTSATTAGPHDRALVVEQDSAVVGALRLHMEGGAAGVYGLAVRPDRRGRGIGRAVLYDVCLEARSRGATKVTLEVEVDNDHALGLYTSVGFELQTTEDYFRVDV